MDSNRLPKIVLDPQNEEQMLAQALSIAREASGGLLRDNQPGSPLLALFEGQAFMTAEMLYYVNLLPPALALEVFRLYGVNRSLGTKARGQVTFVLKATIGNDFALPKGYPIVANGLTFVLSEALLIPAGTVSATVTIEAEKPGSVYNLPEYSVSSNNPSLVHLQSLFNELPISGGTDLEPLDTYITRSQQEIRRRDSIITIADYENAAEALLGNGAIAAAVPLLNGDRTQLKEGHVHLFVQNANGSTPTSSDCAYVRSELVPLVMAASQVWVSPVEVREIEAELILTVKAIDPALSTVVYDKLSVFFSPSRRNLGRTIKIREVEHLAWSVPGITDVTATLDRKITNATPPTKYSRLKLGIVTIIQTTEEGDSYTSYHGTTLEPDIV